MGHVVGTIVLAHLIEIRVLVGVYAHWVRAAAGQDTGGCAQVHLLLLMLLLLLGGRVLGSSGGGGGSGSLCIKIAVVVMMLLLVEVIRASA